jgi:hypothetical protein
MIEDELRAVFTRHEELAPAVAPVAEAIEAGYRRRSRQRLRLRAGSAAVAVTAIVAVPAVAVALHRPAGGPSAQALAGGTATAGAVTDAPAGRPVTVVVALMDGSPGAAPVAVGLAHVPASHDRAYLIALTGDDAAAVGNALHDGKAGPLSSAVARAAGFTVDGVVLVTTAGVSTVVGSLGGIDACPPGGGCQHLTAGSWLPYLRATVATGGLASVGTGVLKGLAAITDPARLSQVMSGSGTVTLLLSADVSGNDDVATNLSGTLRGIRTAAGIVEPAGAQRGELLQDLRADRLDGYLAAHPG